MTVTPTFRGVEQPFCDADRFCGLGIQAQGTVEMGHFCSTISGDLVGKTRTAGRWNLMETSLFKHLVTQGKAP